ncbi:hypothetical protein CLNEO_07520 [Anaerotignum neopropionicum]|uniref:Uncharacterized protein n=1 Tax=Anaerotignum neopropionicum TaxID=36847 RepID=A0A136WG38_9FIRM|nr:hypothetical protein [Anaerotignum neopropionicum]KXL53526.1 hypothetical protein CLNEO_07520 [Anaerotignum neopropionicum]
MKKMILGMGLFVCGFLGVIALLTATVLCPIIPWSYNNIEGWLGVILGMQLQLPLIVFFATGVMGLVICVKEAYQTK